MTGPSRDLRFIPTGGMSDEAYRKLVEQTRRGYRWTKQDVDRLKELVSRIKKR